MVLGVKQLEILRSGISFHMPVVEFAIVSSLPKWKYNSALLSLWLSLDFMSNTIFYEECSNSTLSEFVQYCSDLTTILASQMFPLRSEVVL